MYSYIREHAYVLNFESFFRYEIKNFKVIFYQCDDPIILKFWKKYRFEKHQKSVYNDLMIADVH